MRLVSDKIFEDIFGSLDSKKDRIGDKTQVSIKTQIWEILKNNFEVK